MKYQKASGSTPAPRQGRFFYARMGFTPHPGVRALSPLASWRACLTASRPPLTSHHVPRGEREFQ